MSRGGGTAGGLRQAWFILRTDLAYQLRQRETVVWVFVMPLLFFWFIGTMTGGMNPGGEDPPTRIGALVPDSAGFLANRVVERLEGEGMAVTLETDSAGLARHDLRLRFPRPDGSTFTRSALGREQQVLDLSLPAGSPSAQFARVRVTRAVYGALAELAVARAEADSAGAPVTVGSLAAVDARPRPLEVRVVSAGRRRRPPSGFQQSVPGNMVMFTTLVLLTGGSVMLFVERRDGLLRRLASTPISRAAVVTGKWGSRMALAGIQVGFAVVAGEWLFGVDWGSAPLALTGVLATWAAFNASLSVVLANVADTEPQVTVFGLVAALGLAALGGAWWPIEVAPGWMQSVAGLLPSGWAMEALHRLTSYGYGAPAVMGHVAALAGAALVLGWWGVRTFRYR